MCVNYKWEELEEEVESEEVKLEEVKVELKEEIQNEELEELRKGNRIRKKQKRKVIWKKRRLNLNLLDHGRK